MISMEMLGKIRRMYFRDKLSLHQIAKRTGLSRDTTRKWVRAPKATQPAYERCATFNKLSPFHETLQQALKADSFRPKHNRRSAKALFEQIKTEGYDGGYSQLTAFVRSWRGEQGKSLRAFVPLTFALGEAFQFDWSEESLLIGGLFRRIQVSHMKLCASRAFWLVAYPSQGHEMLFDAHKDRAVPGHWEGDLLCGSRNSQIATLVERHTRYVMLVKLVGKDSETAISALIENARNLPQELYKSLTWDRGKEMADHKRFTVATDIKVYFCDPHRPWQRGSNENTNGLLRQYFPKGTDLADHSQATLNEVARQNSRPTWIAP
ncbi:Integrase core domain-containing protein [Pseudomonas mandelii]|uniref:Integrase core domain-containing protein n=1 Tax=Pseudomonas mandelii TaxID=75612 RepID=A0ABY0W162_9PSED|nr:Integrase core domain-containing protein [Pseudomonas mandelii]